MGRGYAAAVRKSGMDWLGHAGVFVADACVHAVKKFKRFFGILAAGFGANVVGSAFWARDLIGWVWVVRGLLALLFLALLAEGARHVQARDNQPEQLVLPEPAQVEWFTPEMPEWGPFMPVNHGQYVAWNGWKIMARVTNRGQDAVFSVLCDSANGLKPVVDQPSLGWEGQSEENQPIDNDTGKYIVVAYIDHSQRTLWLVMPKSTYSEKHTYVHREITQSPITLRLRVTNRDSGQRHFATLTLDVFRSDPVEPEKFLHPRVTITGVP